jgi:hypothetical protein
VLIRTKAIQTISKTRGKPAMTASTCSYRKTRAGKWVVFGPTSLVRPGSVIVSKRDGSTKEEIVERVGKSFDVDGIEACYGYIAPRRRASGGSADYGAGCPMHGTVEWDGAMCDLCGWMPQLASSL